MRLTFLITDLHRGGSPLLLADLAPGLAARGFDTDVVSIAPLGEIAPLLQSVGIPTTSLLARHNRDLSTLPKFIRHLKSRQPHIILSILIHANLLATLAKPFARWHPPQDSSLKTQAPPTPSVPQCLSASVPSPRPLFIQSLHTLQEKPAWHWALQNFLSPHAHALIAPSQPIIDKLQSKQPVPNPTVIPNGIHVHRFHQAAPIDNPPWPKDAKVVGYIGRFDPVKRLDLLIQTLPFLPANYHLALVGTPDPQTSPHTRHLIQCAAYTTINMNINRIHFLPPTPTPERWYKSFHLFCSLSAAEGYGLTLAEAASAGIPVVACDTPAIRQTLPEAIFVPPNPTPAQVAQAILGIHAHKPLPLEELERRYSLETMVDSYAAHFAAWLAEHARHSAQILVN